jgi:hypothetical protein
VTRTRAVPVAPSRNPCRLVTACAPLDSQNKIGPSARPDTLVTCCRWHAAVKSSAREVENNAVLYCNYCVIVVVWLRYYCGIIVQLFWHDCGIILTLFCLCCFFLFLHSRRPIFPLLCPRCPHCSLKPCPIPSSPSLSTSNDRCRCPRIAASAHTSPPIAPGRLPFRSPLPPPARPNKPDGRRNQRPTETPQPD